MQFIMWRDEVSGIQKEHTANNSLMLVMMIDLSAFKGAAQGPTHLRVSDNFQMTFTSNKERFMCREKLKASEVLSLTM